MTPAAFRQGPWPHRLAALAAGLAAALAHPPFGLLPGLLGYGLIMHLVDRADAGRPLRSAFLRGWLAGVAYFALSTWWVAEAFLVDIAAHGWMAPFAVTFMAAGIALFWGLGALLYRLAGVGGAWRLVAFAGAFSAAEWLRGHVLTGFPWNLVGETWRAGGAMSQAASLVGAYGLTFLTLLIAAAPALLIAGRRARGTGLALGGAGALLAGLLLFGVVRLQTPAAPAPDAPLIRIVQADIAQEAKYDPEKFTRILGAYVDLTRRPAARVPDIVIWPEGAIPELADVYLAPGSWTRAAIAGALRPGQTLLVGAARYGDVDGALSYYNSLVVIRRQAEDLSIDGVYDKHRLVPFGEYLPLKSVLGPLGVRELVRIGDGFTQGPPPRPLAVPGLPVLQPLICYESLYPGFTRRGARASGTAPALIINVSNDAWFGATSGPLQHLNLASYRAIEEGVPMVRATPTGVSAMIDALGRVIPSTRLDSGQAGVIDAPMPPQVALTLYRRLGELPFLLFMIGALTVTLVFRLARVRQRAQDTGQ
ncbi:MAG: apolipoprotein N-acyltransferase [Caulobacter sp.]